MQLKCKICGGDMTVDRATGIAVCDYCGTKQTLPQFTDESSELLYNRGNSYLMHNEFDKAENIFNQLLSINPQDAEIYWDLVMCKYGVNFVKDSKSGKYIPTCNRTHYLPIFQDENYQNAIKFSSGDKQEHYKTNAKTIDNIQKGIISVSKKEKPFDIFISYKETNADGSRTKDSIEAQKLYEKLTEQGYKVFFSRITLEDKAGTQYEPYIYAALSSSKVMLTVCSSRDNIESVWVKNEWSRFLTLRQKDASKTLIPLYFDMPKSDLPDEFAILSSQNIELADFEQELFRGIKKLIPLPIMLAQKRKKRRKRFGIAALVFAVILIIGGAFSIPYVKDYVNKNENYKQVMQLYYEGNYPEAAWGFRDLNGFKDSAEMQKEAEKLWRENLANIVLKSDMYHFEFSPQGAYYIDGNGEVSTFNDDPGVSNDKIGLNEHGKVVSIEDNVNLYALYEDGYVYNSAKNNDMEQDWEDVIQITPVFNSTSVALKSDGTVVYGNTDNVNKEGFEDLENLDDSWLEETKSWNHIVSLTWSFDRFSDGIAGCRFATLIGLDSNGKTHCVYFCLDVSKMYRFDGYQPNYSGLENCVKYLNNLSNIKKINVFFNTTQEYNSNTESPSFDIVATDGKKIFTYINRKEDSINESNVKCIVVNTLSTSSNTYEFSSEIEDTNIFIINSKKELVNLSTDKKISENVVYLNKDYYITMTGRIYENYNLAYTNPNETEVKINTDIINGGEKDSN